MKTIQKLHKHELYLYLRPRVYKTEKLGLSRNNRLIFVVFTVAVPKKMEMHM